MLQKGKILRIIIIYLKRFWCLKITPEMQVSILDTLQSVSWMTSKQGILPAFSFENKGHMGHHEGQGDFFFLYYHFLKVILYTNHSFLQLLSCCALPHFPSFYPCPHPFLLPLYLEGGRWTWTKQGTSS